VNAYVLDPSHIAPSRSDANSNGHFPVNTTSMAQGTPRGFNLANLPTITGFSGFNSSGLFSNFTGQPVPMPAGWTGTQATVPEDGTIRVVGPIRRRGGAQNNRSGPYDRRQARFNNSGRLSPRNFGNGAGAGGRGSGSGGGLGGDGASGTSGIGPSEATAGRTMKSYQDLDAVAGGGGGELDY
jgi:hypothetical protein